MVAYMKGVSPLLAAEMGRRAIPAHLRPSFAEFETCCKQAAGAAATPEAAAGTEAAPQAETAAAAS
jgi:chemotaxis protein MotA